MIQTTLEKTHAGSPLMARCQHLNSLAGRPGNYSTSSNRRLFLWLDNVAWACDWDGNPTHRWTEADQRLPAMADDGLPD